MGNCLKTQLKEVVQNDNLLKMGEVVINVNTEDTDGILYLEGFTSAHVVGNGLIGVSSPTGTTADITNLDTLYYGAGTYKIVLYSKYNATSIRETQAKPGVNMDINEFAYSPNLYHLWLSSRFVNTTKIKTSAFKHLRNFGIFNSGDNYNIDIDIDEFAGGNIQSLELGSIMNAKGNIENLAGCVNLTSLNFWRTPIEGEVNVLAAALAPNKNNGDTLTIMPVGSEITNDGVKADGSYRDVIITFDGQGGYTKSYS